MYMDLTPCLDNPLQAKGGREQPKTSTKASTQREQESVGMYMYINIYSLFIGGTRGRSRGGGSGPALVAGCLVGDFPTSNILQESTCIQHPKH